MIFYEELVDKRLDILNHESHNRHEVVVTVVDQLKLNGLYFSLQFHFLLDGLGSFFLDLLELALCLNFLLLSFVFLRTRHLSEILEVVFHNYVHIDQIYQASKQHNFGRNHLDICSFQQKTFFTFIVRIQLAKQLEWLQNLSLVNVLPIFDPAPVNCEVFKSY